MHRIPFLPDNRPAGYPANPTAGYRISGRILGLTTILLVKYQIHLYPAGQSDIRLDTGYPKRPDIRPAGYPVRPYYIHIDTILFVPFCVVEQKLVLD
jgi:hypothetical protein